MFVSVFLTRSFQGVVREDEPNRAHTHLVSTRVSCTNTHELTQQSALRRQRRVRLHHRLRRVRSVRLLRARGPDIPIFEYRTIAVLHWSDIRGATGLALSLRPRQESAFDQPTLAARRHHLSITPWNLSFHIRRPRLPRLRSASRVFCGKTQAPDCETTSSSPVAATLGQEILVQRETCVPAPKRNSPLHVEGSFWGFPPCTPHNFPSGYMICSVQARTRGFAVFNRSMRHDDADSMCNNFSGCYEFHFS